MINVEVFLVSRALLSHQRRVQHRIISVICFSSCKKRRPYTPDKILNNMFLLLKNNLIRGILGRRQHESQLFSVLPQGHKINEEGRIFFCPWWKYYYPQKPQSILDWINPGYACVSQPRKLIKTDRTTIFV